jgi:8-oxo-dGTP pyrophosphatase MutT (NUDIX family)
MTHSTPSGDEGREEGAEAVALSEPGQELNLDVHSGQGQALAAEKATPPRQAATVIVLRGGEDALEVLLVKRTEKARFMGGVWVFPGGAVDEDDGGDPHRNAAARELSEEAGITIADPGTLVEFSRWITPAEVTIRFDTRFFLVELPEGQEPKIDGEECVDEGWFTPRGALEAHERKEIELVFPTIKHLEQLGAFANVTELLSYAAGREVLPVQPKVWFDGEVARVLLPGEPGYE